MNRQCKCIDCGYVFDFEDRTIVKENHGFDDGLYETFSCCPNCGGDFEDAIECHECGEAFTEDEIYGYKWCEKCLRETINYDTFFEYCESHKKLQLLDTFVMDSLLGGMDCPDNVSWDFHQLMISVYKKKVEDARRFGDQFGFLADCINFAVGDEDGRTHYADWLNEREVK